jgi:hypothetical protein
MTAQHNNVSPSLMEVLQMLKFSFRTGHSLDFTDWLKEDVEKRAMEAILEVRNHPSDKPLDFLQSFRGSVTVLTGRTLDSAVMTTRAEMYN